MSLSFNPGLGGKEIWDQAIVQSKLASIATATKGTHWIKKDLSVKESSCISRFFWNIVAKHFQCLRSAFYGVDTGKSQEILVRLSTYVSDDKQLLELFVRAARKFQEITGREISMPSQSLERGDVKYAAQNFHSATETIAPEPSAPPPSATFISSPPPAPTPAPATIIIDRQVPVEVPVYLSSPQPTIIIHETPAFIPPPPRLRVRPLRRRMPSLPNPVLVSGPVYAPPRPIAPRVVAQIPASRPPLTAGGRQIPGVSTVLNTPTRLHTNVAPRTAITPRGNVIPGRR